MGKSMFCHEYQNYIKTIKFKLDIKVQRWRLIKTQIDKIIDDMLHKSSTSIANGGEINNKTEEYEY